MIFIFRDHYEIFDFNVKKHFFEFLQAYKNSKKSSHFIQFCVNY